MASKPEGQKQAEEMASGLRDDLSKGAVVARLGKPDSDRWVPGSPPLEMLEFYTSGGWELIVGFDSGGLVGKTVLRRD